MHFMWVCLLLREAYRPYKMRMDIVELEGLYLVLSRKSDPPFTHIHLVVPNLSSHLYPSSFPFPFVPLQRWGCLVAP
jgi:hypothetical protein